MNLTDALVQGTMIEEQKRRELSGKLPDELVSAAINRARGMARKHTEHLTMDIRGQAYLQTLVHEMGYVEGWVAAFVTEMAK